MDYISEEKQIVNDYYMTVIKSYLNEMIPNVLKNGYDKVKLPKIETEKTKEIPSQGIYEVIGYVYDTLMGFEGYLGIGPTEPLDIKEFKQTIYNRLEVLKKVMSAREKAIFAGTYDEKKIDIVQVYKNTLLKVEGQPTKRDGRR